MIEKNATNLINQPISRKRILQLAAASLAGATVSTVVGASFSRTSAASEGDESSELVLTGIDADNLSSAAVAMGAALMDAMDEELDEDETIEALNTVAEEEELVGSVTYGPIDTSKTMGSLVTISAGASGFLQIQLHPDGRFTEPLLVKKGVSKETIDETASAICCSPSKNQCTPRIAPGGGENGCYSDTKSDDKPCSSMSEIDFRSFPLEGFGELDRERFATILEYAGGLIAAGDRTSGEDVSDWWSDFGSTGDAFGISDDTVNEARWYDFYITFENGTSAIVQVARGSVEPAIRADDGEELELEEYADVEVFIHEETRTRGALIMPHVLM